MDLLVALPHSQPASVCNSAQQNPAVATRVWPRLVPREPDRVRPVRCIRRGGAEVRDLEAHLDLPAVNALRRNDNVAHNEIGQGLRLNEDALRNSVVGLVGQRVLVDAAARIGEHDEVPDTAIALGDHDRTGFAAVGLARGQRGAVVEARDQDVVAADLVVQREVDVVFPPG